MSILHAIILSIVEGVTEFLPVSSTGHLILATKILGITETDFTKSFDIFIQLGAIMAVTTLYVARILHEPKLIKLTLIAFIPTGILGAVSYKFIKAYLLGNDMVVVATLGGVGFLLILLEQYWSTHPLTTKKTVTSLSVRQLIAIGVFQSFSMVPGVSRAAASIVGGMSMGLSRKDAVEFSFLLAVPTMTAATGLDLLQSAHAFTSHEVSLLTIGFIVSWATAFVVIKAFIRFVERSTFVGFGIYRITVALLYLLSVSL